MGYTGDWNSEDCSLKIGAVEVIDLNKFEADPQDKKTHIESSQGVTGVNRTFKKPIFSLEIIITNAALQTLYDYYANNEKVVITYTAPGYSCTITGAELDRPKPSGDIAKAPTVTITGLGMTCDESYAAEA